MNAVASGISLTVRRALVTGGSRGLGRALAWPASWCKAWLGVELGPHQMSANAICPTVFMPHV